MEYWPSDPVVPTLVIPVVTDVTLTVAPATTAPEGSVAVPRIAVSTLWLYITELKKRRIEQIEQVRSLRMVPPRLKTGKALWGRERLQVGRVLLCKRGKGRC